MHHFIDMAEAQRVLATIGVALTARQLRRAAEPDSGGQRRLPFFIDPVDGRLKIERQALIDVYVKRQQEALRRAGPKP